MYHMIGFGKNIQGMLFQPGNCKPGGSARGRLAEYLLFRYEQEGRPRQLRLSCSMTGLAEMLNIAALPFTAPLRCWKRREPLRAAEEILSIAAPELLRSRR